MTTRPHIRYSRASGFLVTHPPSLIRDARAYMDAAERELAWIRRVLPAWRQMFTKERRG